MTDQELFDKYEILAPTDPLSDNPQDFTEHTDCVDYDGFMKALKEARIDELKQMLAPFGMVNLRIKQLENDQN